MVVFNITFNVDESVETDFIEFTKETFIPLVLKKEEFTDARLCRVLVEEEMGGKTFSLQLTSKDIHLVEEFENNRFPIVYQVLHEKFMNKFVIFTTKMELVHQI